MLNNNDSLTVGKHFITGDYKMADRNKFEEMLERLINEDKEGAEELFHEIVVEKSRDIYEGLLESDLNDLEEDEDTDEEVDEAADADDEDDDEEMDEGFDLDEFEVEGDDDMDMGGDPTDDMMSDLEGGDDDEGEMDMDMDDEGDDEDMEDRVVDLEDALDDLKAEFEKMMADGDEGEEDSDDDADMDVDTDVDAGDDEEDEADKESQYFGEAEDDEDEDEDMDEGSYKKKSKKSDMSETETMREYVEKVTAKMGDNGQNTKSTVADANDMGGDASNLVQGGEADAGGTKGGLADTSTKEEDAGNVNVPGGKASKSMKAQPKGHGAEKKGQGETAANKKSTLGSK